MQKEWWKSKLIWFNLLSGIFLVATLVTGVIFESGEADAIAAGIVAVVNIILRFKTNTALSR